MNKSKYLIIRKIKNGNSPYHHTPIGAYQKAHYCIVIDDDSMIEVIKDRDDRYASRNIDSITVPIHCTPSYLTYEQRKFLCESLLNDMVELSDNVIHDVVLAVLQGYYVIGIDDDVFNAIGDKVRTMNQSKLPRKELLNYQSTFGMNGERPKANYQEPFGMNAEGGNVKK